VVHDKLLQLANQFYSLAMKLNISDRYNPLPPEELEEAEKPRPSGPLLRVKEPFEPSHLSYLKVKAHEIYELGEELRNLLNVRIANLLVKIQNGAKQYTPRWTQFSEFREDLVDAMNEVAGILHWMERKDFNSETLSTKVRALFFLVRKIDTMAEELDLEETDLLIRKLDGFLYLMSAHSDYGSYQDD
jgi:hypothetical protein